eukprot:9529972-Heterocapsa_arctica.AAC.1
MESAPKGESLWLACQWAKWKAGTVMVLTLHAHGHISMLAASFHSAVCPWLSSMKERLPGNPVHLNASGPTSGRGVKVMGKQASVLDACLRPQGADRAEQ